MDYTYVPAEDSSAKAHSVSDSVEREENKDNIRNSNEDLPQSVSLIPTREKGENQVTKKKEGENKMAISNFTNSKTAATSSGSNGDKGRIGQKMKIYKPNHKSLLDQRREIQYLVDFKSKRIVGQPFPYPTFSKHREKMLIYQLISIDGEPLPKLVLCTKCRRLLVLYRASSTNLIRHFVRHEKLEEAQRVAARNKKLILLNEECKPTPRIAWSGGKVGGKNGAKKNKISKIKTVQITPKTEFPGSIEIENQSQVSRRISNDSLVNYQKDPQEDPQKEVVRSQNLAAGESQVRQTYRNEKKHSTETTASGDSGYKKYESAKALSSEARSHCASYNPMLGSEDMPIKID